VFSTVPSILSPGQENNSEENISDVDLRDGEERAKKIVGVLQV
jgi:hypothetical protein